MSSSSDHKSITLLRPIDWKMRVTFWPFLPLYCIILACIADPISIWGADIYENWSKFIDFVNALSLPLALLIHLFVAVLLPKWVPRVRTRTDFVIVPPNKVSDATHVFVDVHEHRGQPGIVPIEFDAGLGCKRFFFQQLKFIYDAASQQFVRPVYPDSKSLGYYRDIVANGLAAYNNNNNTDNNSSEDLSAEHRRNVFGPNVVETTIPPFQEMLADHMMAPFFVFQIFCVTLWMLDEYWMVAMLNGGLMVVLECTVVMQRQRNMKTMRDMGAVPVSDVIVRRSIKGPGGAMKDVFVKAKSTELLPLDVVLVTNGATTASSPVVVVSASQASGSPSAATSSSPSMPAPADMVIVKGSAVLNEATLTGESTPQLKQAVSSSEGDAQREFSDARFAGNTVFNGTLILSSGGVKVMCATDKNEYEGALAVVLRTGFDTKQGQLMRTIAHSQSRVSQNSGESFAFIGLLLVFAIIASSYVLRRGLVDPTKSRWKLFLTCTQIITNVVPPELPMQLTLAVNTSLVSLMRLKVFCTEPFRIPFAGKANVCCFDKTGTLTTDEMLFCGIDEKLEAPPASAPAGSASPAAAAASSLKKNESASAATDDSVGEYARQIGATVKPALYADLVVAACHSLVTLDSGASAGDAMEKASADALGWKVERNDTSSRSVGGAGSKKMTVRTEHRFTFDPTLRRMSCIVTVSGAPQSASSVTTYIVAKGSPESIASVLSKESMPHNYFAASHRHTARGIRVIALAYRAVADPAAIHSLSKDRALAETDLTFCGFCLFDCPLKKDARDCIEQLNMSSHKSVMITGDSCRTAVVVAKKVSMIVESDDLANKKPATVYVATAPSNISCSNYSSSSFVWCPMDSRMELDRSRELAALPPAESGAVGAVDGDEISQVAFNALLETLPPAQLLQIAVWSRCPPTHKEDIVCTLRKRCGATVLMAGDGTNDVGGLKQAHVGIAVLNSSSFQQQQQASPAASPTTATAAAALSSSPASSASSALAKLQDGEPAPPAPLPDSAGFIDRMKHAMATAQFQAALQQWQQANPGKRPTPSSTAFVPGAAPSSPSEPRQPPPLPASAGIMERAKHTVAMAQYQAALTQWQKQQAAAANKAGKLEAVAKEKGLASADAASAMMSMFNEMEDENDTPMVKLGDASIAAPFTVKSRKLTAVCDIVRLGRTSLVVTLNMYRIIALNCLVSAYTMAVLFTDGVKFSQTQMVSSGIVLAICFLLLSTAKPLEVLSARRPITRVFHPYMMVSIFGQFAVHLYSLSSAVDLVQNADAEGVASQKGDDEEVDFKPSLLNSIVFMMTTLMSAGTFAVNFRAYPWMTTPKAMYALLAVLVALVFYCASEFDLEFNQSFEITPFPSDDFRTAFQRLLLADILGTWAIEYASEFFLGSLP